MEYDSEETDHFIALADAIEERFPGVAVDGREKEDGPRGFFRVRGGSGDVLFATEDGAALPEPQEIISILQDAGYPAEG